ncbi:hypothetical protein M0805_009772 [Coniferiporia weirii]|nr:hypothetical protein M0805_009772 [Coniferiporia weirii]
MVGALAAGLLLSAGCVAGGSSSSGVMRRSAQSVAVCIDNFDWMDNSLRQSPCLVAAYLLAECVGGDWTVEPTTPSSHYAPPNSTTENQCQCSWAVYNTIQACADCQGQDFSSAIFSWPGWSGNCSSNLLSDSVAYPVNVTIPAETAIPFWATTDPTTWNDEIFNPTAAQSLAGENKPDITQASRQAGKKKKSNAGAIAGGVVGGVVFVAALGLLVTLFLRRRRLYRATPRRQPGVQAMPLPHARSNSDLVNHKYYGNLSPSPDPTLPVSYDSHGFARPPFNSIPTGAPSFSTFPTTTASPPLEYMSPQPPGKVMMGVMPMVAMNHNYSNPTLSTAYATVAHQSQHTHTLSNQSNITSALSHERGPSVSSAGGHPEGAIDPYMLPPTRSEPMGSEEMGAKHTSGDDGAGMGAGMGPGGETFFAVATRKTERRNPPAYSHVTPPAGAGAGSGTRDSMEAQAAETGTGTQALSGTTLQDSSTRADQSVVNDGPPPADRARDRDAGRYGYPADRKG